MESKKYQVFISSTYTDLIIERNAVTQCLLDNNCIPVGMEQFPASNMSQMDYIRKMLDDCDYYILILAGRYGSVDKNGVGYTEKEYDYAASCGIPIMSFVVKDINSLRVSQCESDKQLYDKLIRFREKVCNGKLVKFYSNADELKGHVAASIYRCIHDFPARGWVRGSENHVSLKMNNSVLPTKETPNRFVPNWGVNNNLSSKLREEDLISLLKQLYLELISCASLSRQKTEKKEGMMGKSFDNIHDIVRDIYILSDVYIDANSLEGEIAKNTVRLYNHFVFCSHNFAEKREKEDVNTQDASTQLEMAFSQLRKYVAKSIKTLDT